MNDIKKHVYSLHHNEAACAECGHHISAKWHLTWQSSATHRCANCGRGLLDHPCQIYCFFLLGMRVKPPSADAVNLPRRNDGSVWMMKPCFKGGTLHECSGCGLRWVSPQAHAAIAKALVKAIPDMLGMTPDSWPSDEQIDTGHFVVWEVEKFLRREASGAAVTEKAEG